MPRSAGSLSARIREHVWVLAIAGLMIGAPLALVVGEQLGAIPLAPHHHAPPSTHQTPMYTQALAWTNNTPYTLPGGAAVGLDGDLFVAGSNAGVGVYSQPAYVVNQSMGVTTLSFGSQLSPVSMNQNACRGGGGCGVGSTNGHLPQAVGIDQHTGITYYALGDVAMSSGTTNLGVDFNSSLVIPNAFAILYDPWLKETVITSTSPP